MKRQEVYDLYYERICEDTSENRQILSQILIDAIIDCAKEETIEYLKKNWLTVGLGGFLDE